MLALEDAEDKDESFANAVRGLVERLEAAGDADRTTKIAGHAVTVHGAVDVEASDNSVAALVIGGGVTLGNPQPPSPPSRGSGLGDEGDTPSEARSIVAQNGSIAAHSIGYIAVSSQTPPLWPRTIGVLPPEAGCFQVRETSAAIASGFAQRTAEVEGAPSLSCQVLSGLGGVGKSQLAAHYARSRWSAGAVDLLMWLTATSRDAVVQEYSQAAVAIGVATSVDPERRAREFLSWLATTDKVWLIVLDDLANPGDVSGLWPPSHATGRALVTTRRQDAALTGAGRRLLDVGTFTKGEADSYVAAKLAAHGRADDPAEIARLTEDLGYLPIGLAQAVAYLVDLELTCAQYRARWADRRRRLSRLVPQGSALPDDQQATLSAVWSLSAERADALEPVGLAGPMLELASMLDPNGIPLSVLDSEMALAYLTRRGRPQNNGANQGDENARDALRGRFASY